MELVNFLVECVSLYLVSQRLVEGVTLHGVLFGKFNSVRDSSVSNPALQVPLRGDKIS